MDEKQKHTDKVAQIKARYKNAMEKEKMRHANAMNKNKNKKQRGGMKNDYLSINNKLFDWRWDSRLESYYPTKPDQLLSDIIMLSKLPGGGILGNLPQTAGNLANALIKNSKDRNSNFDMLQTLKKETEVAKARFTKENENIFTPLLKISLYLDQIRQTNRVWDRKSRKSILGEMSEEQVQSNTKTIRENLEKLPKHLIPTLPWEVKQLCIKLLEGYFLGQQELLESDKKDELKKESADAFNALDTYENKIGNELLEKYPAPFLHVSEEEHENLMDLGLIALLKLPSNPHKRRN